MPPDMLSTHTKFHRDPVHGCKVGHAVTQEISVRSIPSNGGVRGWQQEPKRFRGGKIFKVQLPL